MRLRYPVAMSFIAAGYWGSEAFKQYPAITGMVLALGPALVIITIVTVLAVREEKR